MRAFFKRLLREAQSVEGLDDGLHCPERIVDADSRWSLLDRLSFKCSTCNDVHTGLIHLGSSRPASWNNDKEPRSNRQVDEHDEVLTEDFCKLATGDRFVRCILEIPLKGASPGQVFTYGVWSSLSEKNFNFYKSHFDDDFSTTEAWFGWFSSAILGYPDTLLLQCDVSPQGRNGRPKIILHDADHPLVREQQAGIDFGRYLEILAANGHDIRDAVSQHLN